MLNKRTTLPFLSFLSSVLLFFSCGNNKEVIIHNEASKSDVAEANGTKYIEFKDAPIILENWNKENTLFVHTNTETNSFHPTNDDASTHFETNFYTQITLLRFNLDKNEVYPLLLKSKPKLSADNKIIEMEINDFMKWDDGNPVTVEDVIFTMKANKCPLTNNPHYKPMLDQIEDIIVDKENSNKFKVIMENSYFLNLWMWIDYPILQRTFFDKENVLANYSFKQFNDTEFKADKHVDLKKWATNFNDPKYGSDPDFLTGAGPYKIDKWEKGQFLTLIKKKNHWSENRPGLFTNAFPNKIIYKINHDPNSTKLDFKNQVYDVTTYIDPNVLEELQADSNFNKNYNSKLVDTYYYSYAVMNQKSDGLVHKKLFTDKKVRRAIAHLFPMNDLNKLLSNGRSTRMVTCVSPHSLENNTKLLPIQFDIELAKKLLAEAGWADSDGDQILDKVIDGKKIKFEFDAYFSNSIKTWETMASIISENMKKAGINMRLTPLDFNVLREKMSSHDFDMVFSSWSSSAAPEDFSQIWSTKSWANHGSNYGGFGNTETDLLINQMNETVVDSIRIPLCHKFQEIVYNEQPYVFMFATLRKVIIHKRFGNQKVYFDFPGILFNNLKLLKEKH